MYRKVKELKSITFYEEDLLEIEKILKGNINFEDNYRE